MRVVPVEREPVPVDPIRLDPIRLDTIPLDTVLDAVRALQRGLPVLVVDDEDRENEGDVIIAAEHATAEWVAWAVRHGSGLLCAPMPAGWADRLRLPPMVVDNQDPRRTDYTVSVDAASGVGTGISAADRARTVRVLADPESGPQDVIRPGHVFPLRARPGGVLERSGHTEAAVDLCRLAGLSPVGLITEVVEDDGTLMRLPALRRLADSRDLPLISIEDLVAHRRELGEERSEHRVERVAVTRLPTRFGTFEAHGYRDRHTAAEHVVLLASSPAVSEPASDPVSEPVSPPVSQPESRVPLVRVHSECLTGDTLGSLRCDCGPQLETSLREVAAAGGAVVYLGGHEGRGIGLLAKLAAYQLQDDGQDTVSANLSQGLPVDAREYGAAAAILHDLGLTRIALLTNNPAKVEALVERGIEVVSRIPLVVGESEHNRSYLRTKRQLMGHQL